MITFSYDQTLNELDNLQKQFQRMELNRRQKVNIRKLKRNQQLLTEYKIKIKDEHIKLVRQRRASLDNLKTREKINKSAQNQRRRESRLKLLEMVGPNALKYGHLFSAQQKQNKKRRENVLQRKQEIQREKEKKRKEDYLQKQKLRDQKIAKVLSKRKKLRPKSTENDDNKENDHFRSFTSFDEYFHDENTNNYDSRSDDISNQIFQQKQMLRSKSEKNLRSSSGESSRASSRASSLNIASDNFVNRNKKRKYYGFMQPTLSTYLITNNPSSLFAAC